MGISRLTRPFKGNATARCSSRVMFTPRRLAARLRAYRKWSVRCPSTAASAMLRHFFSWHERNALSKSDDSCSDRKRTWARRRRAHVISAGRALSKSPITICGNTSIFRRCRNPPSMATRVADREAAISSCQRAGASPPATNNASKRSGNKAAMRARSVTITRTDRASPTPPIRA